MKKTFLMMCLAVLGFSAITTAQNYVTLYTDCDYRGASQMFKAGEYTLANTRIGSQNLSSLRIPAGFKVLLYTSATPGNGQKIRLTADDRCLSSQGWNDKSLSFVVEKEGAITQLPDYRPVPDNNLVTIYEDCYYNGNYRSLSAGYHDTRDLGIRNDGLSSIKIPYGWSIKVFEDGGYKGRSATFSYDVSCMPYNWNDRVSSVYISKDNNNNNNNINNGTAVTLYKDCEYRGESKSLGLGYFNVNDLGIGNDQLSSLKVPEGYSVTLYTDPGYRGNRATFTNDVYCLSRDWNDKVSSIHVAKTYYGGNNSNINNNTSNNTVNLYENENFGGRSVSLYAGSYNYLPNTGFPDNALSSLQLPRGWKVVLYDQPNFKGSSYTVLRTKEKFLFSGWGDRASSMIIYTSGGTY